MIREATLSDVPAMVTLINRIIAKGGTTAHETLYDDSHFAEVYLTDAGAIACFVSDAPDAGLLGFQVLGHWPGLPGGWVDIGTFVAEEARGTGTGAALFAATKALAKTRGDLAINATIRADNALGLAYYDKCGFRNYAADPDYRLSDGTRVGRVSKRFDLV
jgi:GNAT superfamily N-acetyltransferase